MGHLPEIFLVRVLLILQFPCQAVQLHLRRDQFMFDLIKFLDLGGQALAELVRLFLELEIVVGRIEVEQQTSHLLTHPRIAFRRLDLCDLVVQICRHPLQILFALLSAHGVDLSADQNLCLIFRGHSPPFRNLYDVSDMH